MTDLRLSLKQENETLGELFLGMVNQSQEEVLVYGDETRTDDSSFFNSALMEFMDDDPSSMRNPLIDENCPSRNLYGGGASKSKKRMRKLESRDSSNAHSKGSKSRKSNQRRLKSKNTSSNHVVNMYAVTPIKNDESKFSRQASPRENTGMNVTSSKAKPPIPKLGSKSQATTPFMTSVNTNKGSKALKENIHTNESKIETHPFGTQKGKPQNHLKDSELFQRINSLNPETFPKKIEKSESITKDFSSTVRCKKNDKHKDESSLSKQPTKLKKLENQFTASETRTIQQKFSSNTIVGLMNTVLKGAPTVSSENDPIKNPPQERQNILQKLSTFKSDDKVEKFSILQQKSTPKPQPRGPFSAFLSRANTPGSLLEDILSLRDQPLEEKRKDLPKNSNCSQINSRSNSIERSISRDENMRKTTPKPSDRGTCMSGKSAYFMQTLDSVISKNKKPTSKMSNQS